MSNTKGIAIVAIIVLLLGGSAALMMFLSRIPSNSPDAVGNSAGNLYNNGLFCEDDGIVYFSNPYDGGAMYSMNPDESNLKKILQYNVKYINAEGDYIYYYQTEKNDAVVMGFAGHTMGIYRCNKNGRKVVCLDRAPSGTVSLVGDYIYYEHYTNENEEGMSLYKIGTDKKDGQQVADFIIDPANVYQGDIYFAATKDNHDLLCLDTDTDTYESVFSGKVWQPIISDGYVYYMNVGDDYKLYRADLSSFEEEKINDERVESFNMAAGKIYYQTNGEEPALKSIDVDGSNETVIRAGIHNNINVTSQYVYFTQFDTDIPVYRVRLGDYNVTEFVSAKQVAIENMK